MNYDDEVAHARQRFRVQIIHSLSADDAALERLGQSARNAESPRVVSATVDLFVPFLLDPAPWRATGAEKALVAIGRPGIARLRWHFAQQCQSVMRISLSRILAKVAAPINDGPDREMVRADISKRLRAEKDALVRSACESAVKMIDEANPPRKPTPQASPPKQLVPATMAKPPTVQELEPDYSGWLGD